MYLIFYFLIINNLLFILMGIDKKKAILNKWRISEKTLFLIAILGGSIGGIVGMYLFHHKTKHLKFKIGFPLISIVEFFLIYKIYITF